MCATVCPTPAIFYGTYEEGIASGRVQQGAKSVNIFFFGRQRVRTRNYVVVGEQEEALDLLSLVAEANLGWHTNLPAATANQYAAAWVNAETAGIPQPWMPHQPLEPAPVSPASKSNE